MCVFFTPIPSHGLNSRLANSCLSLAAGGVICVFFSLIVSQWQMRRPETVIERTQILSLVKMSKKKSIPCQSIFVCVTCAKACRWGSKPKRPPVCVSRPYGFWCSLMIGPASAGYKKLQWDPEINWNMWSMRAICSRRWPFSTPSVFVQRGKRFRRCRWCKQMNLHSSIKKYIFFSFRSTCLCTVYAKAGLKKTTKKQMLERNTNYIFILDNFISACLGLVT